MRNCEKVPAKYFEAAETELKTSRARKPWSANCELKHWNFGGEKSLIHGLHFTVYALPNSRFVRLFLPLILTVYAPFSGPS